MNLLFGAPACQDSEKFLPGTYSRYFRSGNHQLTLEITFTSTGVIKFSPSEILQKNVSSYFKYKCFGQVIRIHQAGDSNLLAYYSFFFDKNRLHLCALTDENEVRKMIMNSSWRRESYDPDIQESTEYRMVINH